jgi:SpoVK/Ycf46/Vps4 family AAA+-type ATPase
LVLPLGLLKTLEHLYQQVRFQAQQHPVQQVSTPAISAPHPGAIALLAGASGTGKMAVARAVSTVIQTSLHSIDLAVIEPSDHESLVQAILRESPPLLVLKSAQVWVGHSAPLSTARLQRFWQQRQAQAGITLFTVKMLPLVKLQWQRQFDLILELPMPDVSARQQLWQQALSTTLLDADVDQAKLARQLRLSGRDIYAIAQHANRLATAESPPRKLGMSHILQAWEYHYAQRLAAKLARRKLSHG